MQMPEQVRAKTSQAGEGTDHWVLLDPVHDLLNEIASLGRANSVPEKLHRIADAVLGKPVVVGESHGTAVLANGKHPHLIAATAFADERELMLRRDRRERAIE